MRKITHGALLCLALSFSFQWAVADTADPGTPIVVDKKLYRRGGNMTGRPQLPPNRNDYLSYGIGDGKLWIMYPANSLPATVSITDAAYGYSCYAMTVLNEDPLDLDLAAGEYTLTVTLVDDRTYSGNLTIE